MAASLAALALPAGAASSTPSKGRAKSVVTLVQVKLAGTSIAAGRISAVADNAAPHIAKLVITPVTSSLTGPLGQQTVTPDSGDVTVPTIPKSVDFPAG